MNEINPLARAQLPLEESLQRTREYSNNPYSPLYPRTTSILSSDAAPSLTPHTPISVASLPTDVIAHVFSFLPPGSLLMVSSTCARWWSICTNTHFDNITRKKALNRLLDINRQNFSETESSTTSSFSSIIRVSSVIRMIYQRLSFEKRGLTAYFNVLVHECGLPLTQVLRQVLRNHRNPSQLIEAPTDALTLKQCSFETKKYVVQTLIDLKDFNLILEHIHEWLPQRVDQHMLWECILDNRCQLRSGCHDRITALFNSTNQEKVESFLRKCHFNPKNTAERLVERTYNENLDCLFRNCVVQAANLRIPSTLPYSTFFSMFLVMIMISKNANAGLIMGFFCALLPLVDDINHSANARFNKEKETLLTAVQHSPTFAEWEKQLIGQLPAFIISASQDTLPRDYFCPVSRVPLYCPLKAPDGRSYDAETLLNELKRNPDKYRFSAFQLRPDFQLQQDIFKLLKVAITAHLSRNHFLPDPVFKDLEKALNLFLDLTAHKMHSKLERLTL